MTVFNSRTTSSKDDWETPPELFDPLNKIFDFNVDAAASKNNKKCECFLDDAFKQQWDQHLFRGDRVWCNPPFTRKAAFVNRALQFRQSTQHIVFLLPSNARETKWWNELVVPFADQIINLVGRVNFLSEGKPTKGCNFPSCLVVYRPRLTPASCYSPQEIYWDWRNA